MPGASVVFVRRSIELVVRSLPTLPSAVTQIVKEADRPDASPMRLEKFIQTDPALTAQVLRVVNSAYYGLSRQVSNIGQAIVILGIQQVRNLALSVGAIGSLTGRTPQGIQTAKRFWKHSAAVSGGLQALSSRTPMTSSEADAVKVAGLIHDLGRLCVMTSFGTLYDSVVACALEDEVPVETAELQILGLTHADVGRQIAEHWMLPSVLVELIGWHEGPFTATDSPSLMALNATDTLSKLLYFPDSGLEAPPLLPIVRERLSLSDADVVVLTQEMEDRAKDLEDAFGLMAA